MQHEITEEDVERKVRQVTLAQKLPWYFLKHVACTLDEHDPSTLAKPFPNKLMYRVVTRFWNEYDVVFIEKSRQIMMTWIMACLCLWDAMTKKARLIFFQSKKQDDADAVLGRAKHVYEQCVKLGIPWVPRAKMIGDKLGTASELEFPDRKSLIQAIPQGPDIVRSHTCSRIFADEMNHQPEFAEGYAAAIPTIHGGGQYTAQGTANAKTFGWMRLKGIDDRTLEKTGKNLIDSGTVRQKLFKAPEGLTEEEARRWIEKTLVDLPEEEFNAIPFAELVACVPGMRYWRTAQGTDCLRVHYTADPDKDPKTEVGAAWVKKARKTMTVSKWEREMEIRYDTFDGRPVLPQFTREIYVKKPEFDSNYPLIVSIDFGKICGAAFGQAPMLRNHNVRQAQFMSEIFLENSNTVELAMSLEEELLTRYYWAWRNNSVRFFCDPAGNQERETTADKSLNSSVKILNSKGMYPFSKKFGVPESVDFVEAMFARMLPNGEPAVIVHERCEYLISVAAGGWHYPPDGKGRPGYPEKDNWFEHGGDFYRYFLCNIFNEFDATGDRKPATPQPQYVRRHYTGEIIGVRKRRRKNPMRGQHLVRS